MVDPSPIPGPRPIRSTVDPYRRQLHPLIESTVAVLPDVDVGMTDGALRLWLAALEANLRFVYRLDKPEPAAPVDVMPPTLPRPAPPSPPPPPLTEALASVPESSTSSDPQVYPQPVDDVDASPPPEPAEGLPAGDVVDHGQPAAPAAALEFGDDPPPNITAEPVRSGYKRHFTDDQRRAAVAWTLRQLARTTAGAPTGITTRALADALDALNVNVNQLRRWLADPRYQPNAEPMPPASADLEAVANGDGTVRIVDALAEHRRGIGARNLADLADLEADLAGRLEAELAGRPDPDPDPDDLAAEAAQPVSLPPGDPFPSSRIRVDDTDLADDADVCRGCGRNPGARHRLACTQLDRTAERRAARRLDASRANLAPTPAPAPTTVTRPAPSGMPFEKRPFDPDRVRDHAGIGVDPTSDAAPR